MEDFGLAQDTFTLLEGARSIDLSQLTQCHPVVKSLRPAFEVQMSLELSYQSSEAAPGWGGKSVIQVADKWSGAGTVWPTEVYIPVATTQVVIDPSASPMLTDRMREILSSLLGLLGREARKRFLPVRKIEVRGFVDPEEDEGEIVVTQWVKVPQDTALAYWDRLGAPVEAWISSLPKRVAGIAADRLAIEVRWDTNDAAA